MKMLWWYDDDFDDDVEYRGTGSIGRLFKNDYYKPIKTDDGFARRRSNYIEYMSRRDRYKNLSPKEYLDMIRPYLADLIDCHKSTTELNNNDKRGDWKIQLVIQNKCISTKNFKDTRNVYSASKPVELFMGVDTNDAIDRLFDTLLKRFQKAIETSHDNGSGVTQESVALLYYYFMKIDIRRAESYVMSPNWKAKSAKWKR